MAFLKQLKRRGIQTFLEAVGADEETHDVEFEGLLECFNSMRANFEVAGAAVTDFGVKQKALFVSGMESSFELNKFWNGEYNIAWPPEVPDDRILGNGSENLRAEWADLNDITRRSCAKVLLDMAIQPLGAVKDTLFVEVDDLLRRRHDKLIDCDSYRRRVRRVEAKLTTTAANDPNRAAVQAEYNKYDTKLTAAEAEYLQLNTQAKETIKQSKLAVDELLEMTSIAMFTLQWELFREAAQRLERITDAFPADRVEMVRKQFRSLLAVGGPDRKAPEQKTQLRKGLEIIAGIRTASEIEADERREAEEKARRDARREYAINQQTTAEGPVRSGEAPDLQKAPLKREASKQKSSRLRSNSPPPPAVRRGLPPGGLPRAKGRPAPAPPKRAAVAPPKRAAGAPPARKAAPAPPKRAAGAPPKAAPAPPKRAAAPPPARKAAPAPPKRAAPPPKRAAPAPAAKNIVIAIFDNEPDDADELAFKVGDRITVLKKDNSGWWTGSVNGKTGMFPSNYTKAA